MNEQLTQRIGKLSKQQQELLALLLNNQSNEITERPSKNTLMSASSSQKDYGGCIKIILTPQLQICLWHSV
ncbi:hypothetical protein F6Y05_40005 [Bacillus megaterium]|nr:hypothetical protein [Priestia megaterium]